MRESTLTSLFTIAITGSMPVEKGRVNELQACQGDVVVDVGEVLGRGGRDRLEAHALELDDRARRVLAQLLGVRRVVRRVRRGLAPPLRRHAARALARGTRRGVVHVIRAR